MKSGGSKVSAVRVLVVDDNAEVRAAVCAHLLSFPWIAVVGEAADGDQALIAVQGVNPDVVLMDVAMPGCNGIEATRLLRVRMPNVAVVLVSVNGSALIERLAAEAGADAFVSKDEMGERLAGILRSVVDGKSTPYLGGAI